MGGREEDEIDSARRVPPRNAGVPPQAEMKKAMDLSCHLGPRKCDHLERRSQRSAQHVPCCERLNPPGRQLLSKIQFQQAEADLEIT